MLNPRGKSFAALSAAPPLPAIHVGHTVHERPAAVAATVAYFAHAHIGEMSFDAIASLASHERHLLLLKAAGAGGRSCLSCSFGAEYPVLPLSCHRASCKSAVGLCIECCGCLQPPVVAPLPPPPPPAVAAADCVSDDDMGGDDMEYGWRRHCVPSTQVVLGEK